MSGGFLWGISVLLFIFQIGRSKGPWSDTPQNGCCGRMALPPADFRRSASPAGWSLETAKTGRGSAFYISYGIFFGKGLQSFLKNSLPMGCPKGQVLG